jgi:K+-transporting ATPase ATPase B chain
VRVTQEPGQGFLDRMIALVEGAERQKTPNEIALTILLVGLTIIFLIAVATVPAFARYAGGHIPVAVLAALLITLIPTTIAALLSAIGIAGMDRLVRFNVLAKSGRAVEAAGDVDVLLLDKTGTITIGDRQACAFRPLDGIAAARWRRPPCWRAWPTRRPKAAPSSCSRARRSVWPSMPCPQARRSFPSPRRPGFRA